MDSEQEMRAKVSEFRLLQAQLQEGSRQLEALEQARAEVHAALQAIAQLPNKENPALVPLGSGVYAKANITSKDTVLVEVGARVIAEKSTAEAKVFLETKLQEIEATLTTLKNELDKFANRVSRLQGELSANGMQ